MPSLTPLATRSESLGPLSELVPSESGGFWPSLGSTFPSADTFPSSVFTVEGVSITPMGEGTETLTVLQEN